MHLVIRKHTLIEKRKEKERDRDRERGLVSITVEKSGLKTVSDRKSSYEKLIENLKSEKKSNGVRAER